MIEHVPIVWLLARTSGIVTWAALSSSIIFGLIMAGRPLGKQLSPLATLELHRSLSIAGFVALIIHMAALVADTTVDIPLQALVIPGLIEYRPFWSGLGVVAAELMLIIHVSSHLRRRIGQRSWRRIHYMSYPTFLAATAHGVFAGTDAGQPWSMLLYAGVLGLVTGLLVWRILAGRKQRRTTPAATARGNTV